MTDLYHAGGGVGISSFRANTEKQRVMAGASITPTMQKCTSCGKRRTVVTGKITKAVRFVCCSCHSPRAIA